MKLIEGQAYRVTYVAQKGNGRWYRQFFIAVYIGRTKNEFVDELVWSGRPLYGTMEQQVRQIEKISPADRLHICRPMNVEPAAKPSWAD